MSLLGQSPRRILDEDRLVWICLILQHLHIYVCMYIYTGTYPHITSVHPNSIHQKYIGSTILDWMEGDPLLEWSIYLSLVEDEVKLS